MPANVYGYKTYAVRSPLETHYRKATCVEVNCEAYRNGWQFRKEGMTAEMLFYATHCGKRYRELQVAPGETYLVYEPGQRCFEASFHTVSLERPEWDFVGRGDSSVFQTDKARRHTKREFWVEDFQHHLEKINRLIELRDS